MSTPFSSIYSRFLRKITDLKLANLIVTVPTIADGRLYGWLESATTKFDECEVDLIDIDLISQQFNQTLTPKAQEIIAIKMLIEWFEPMINDVLAMQNSLSDSDFKQYSSANLMKEKSDRLNQMIQIADNLITNYSYTPTNIKGLG
ncbi:MAG TPA: hypothetical protein VIM42_12305 [Clostridium sp.]